MDDRRQSSAATSLTGISVEGGSGTMDLFARGYEVLQEGKMMQENRSESNDGMRKRRLPGDPSIFIDAPPMGGSDKHGNSLSKCAA